MNMKPMLTIGFTDDAFLVFVSGQVATRRQSANSSRYLHA